MHIHCCLQLAERSHVGSQLTKLHSKSKESGLSIADQVWPSLRTTTC